MRKNRLSYKNIASLVCICLSLCMCGCTGADTSMEKAQAVVDEVAAGMHEAISVATTEYLDENGNYDGVEYLQMDETYQKGADEKTVTNDSALRNQKVISEEDVMKALAENQNYFYFLLLDNEERKTYAEIYCAIKNMEDDVTLSTLNLERVDKAFKYMYYDHPELYYVSGYTYTKTLMNDEPVSLAISGYYTMNESEVKAYKEYVNNYVVDFKSALGDFVENADDYNIVKFTYEYVIDHTDYDVNAPHNQSIISAMAYGHSVCAGYSRTMQYLLRECGIDITFVMGTSRNGEAHSWNLLKADGEYYYMDVTYGDESYSLAGASEELADSLPKVNYNYMLMDYAETCLTHVFEDDSIMPRTTANADNYFIREGLYFTDVNTDQLSSAFYNAYLRNDEYIMLKMNSLETYEAVWNYLLDEQKVFDYLQNHDGTVAYAQNKDQLYMIFWI